MTPGEHDAKSKDVYMHDYDSAITKEQHARRVASSHAAFFLPYLRPNMTLLDCGCGSGSITVGLAEAVAPGQTIGVDIAEIEIERARNRSADSGIDNVTFELGDVCALEYADNEFDAVFCHNLLEHLAEPVAALSEMRRVLKPDGVIGVRDFDLSGSLLAPPQGTPDRFFALYRADWLAVGGHPDLGRGLRGLLHDAGFSVLRASASYDVYGTAEEIAFLARLAASRCAEPAFAQRVVDKGIATRDELAELQDSLALWAEDPAAFAALAHGEAVASKRER
jgi:ubiquinone/menaquinone biosynthesis C-methylase UbiE